MPPLHGTTKDTRTDRRQVSDDHNVPAQGKDSRPWRQAGSRGDGDVEGNDFKRWIDDVRQNIDGKNRLLFRVRMSCVA